MPADQSFDMLPNPEGLAPSVPAELFAPAVPEIPAPLAGVEAVASVEVLPPANDEEKAKRVESDYLWAKGEREALYDPLWEDCWNLYENVRPDEDETGEWRSKIAAPIAFTTVEEIVPHLQSGIFGHPDFVRVTRPALSKGGDLLAQMHERLILAQVHGEADLMQRFEVGNRQKLIVGTTWYYVGFELRMVPGDVDDPTGLSGQGGSTVEYAGNYVEYVDNARVYVHPYSTDSFMPKIWWVRYFSMRQLQKMGGMKNLDLVAKECSGRGKHSAYTTMGTDRAQQFGAMNDTPLPNLDEKVYEVITQYDNEERVVTSVVEGKVVIEDRPFPNRLRRCPLVVDRHITIPGRPYGVGAIEKAVPLIHEQNAIRNERRDNLHLAISGMVEVPTSALDDEEHEMVTRPYGIIHSRDGQSVRALQFPVVTNNSEMELSRNNDEIARVSGATPAMSGQPVGTSGVDNNLMLQSSVKRLQQSVANSGRALKKVVELMIANNSTFWPLDEVKEAFTPFCQGLWEGIPPQDITFLGNVEVQVLPFNQNPDVMRQQVINLVNVLASNPLLSANKDFDYLAMRVIRLFGEDPIKCIKMPGVLPEKDAFIAGEENKSFLDGSMPPGYLADPMDNHDVHVSMHNAFLASHPEKVVEMAPHVQSHISMKEQAAMMAQAGQMGMMVPGGGAGENGPGSLPAGGRGGSSNGMNPNRQPAPTGDLGIARSQARLQGSK